MVKIIIIPCKLYCASCHNSLPRSDFDMKPRTNEYYKNCRKCKIYCKSYYSERKPDRRDYQRIYDSKEVNKDKKKLYGRQFRKEGRNRCKHNIYKYSCKICDPVGHLISTCRSHIYRALFSNNILKENHTIDYLGCSILFLKEHIQKQFKPHQNWDNHGEVWEIDHIIPIRYDNPTEEEVIKRLHYSNLQPLDKEINRSKKNRYIG